MLACLGRANSWITLPLLAIVAIMLLVALVSPNRLPNAPPGPVWWRRVVAAVLLGIVVVAAGLALHEAQTDPDCRGTSAALSQPRRTGRASAT